MSVGNHFVTNGTSAKIGFTPDLHNVSKGLCGLSVAISLTIYRGHLGLSARRPNKVSKRVLGASRPARGAQKVRVENGGLKPDASLTNSQVSMIF